MNLKLCSTPGKPKLGKPKPGKPKLQGWAVFLLWQVAVLLCGAPPAARAVLTIEVNKGIATAIPIAIVPFSHTGVSATLAAPADIIQSNLAASGRFEPVPRRAFQSQPHDLQSIQYAQWRALKAEALVLGQVVGVGNNQYEVRFQLVDVFRGKYLIGKKFVVSAEQIRKAAHQISDIIYEQLTGIPGAFDTKIAYVTVRGQLPHNYFLLQIADSDGYAAQTVFESPDPILSPAWSPDGDHLAYVAFNKRRTGVYIQNIRNRQRQQIPSFPGINSAPAWSPSGDRLALTLSKDGNCEIYIYTLANRRLQRLTRHTAIDTEPAWSPDGRFIVFTSGRAGTPQIYRVPSSGGTPKRLTFNGKYNAGASYAKDGKSLVLVTNQGNGYRVGLYSSADKRVVELTRSSQDESPSFAANGDMIVYATKLGGQSVLAAISVDGQVQQTLRIQDGVVREPAWSP